MVQDNDHQGVYCCIVYKYVFDLLLILYMLLLYHTHTGYSPAMLTWYTETPTDSDHV